jgi:ubiquinone/menaquinone biosynthesis C-methylase UbiE
LWYRANIVALLLCAFTLAPCVAADAHQQEADRLAVLLNWRAGSVVAEIGAGEGQITVAAAERVGAAGRVYATELDAKKLAHLEEIARKQKNISAIKAAIAETNLPPECCDSIFMRLVYHHLIKPVEIDASLFRSLKPGGQLAVIDEEPKPGVLKSGGCARKPRRPRHTAENPDRGAYRRWLPSREDRERLARELLLRGVQEAQPLMGTMNCMLCHKTPYRVAPTPDCQPAL